MTISKKLIENVKDLKTALNEISVYDLDVYTSMELYYNVAKKLNEVINELSRFEDVVSDEVVEQNKILSYMLKEGLKTEVSLKINELVQNGVITDLLNNIVLVDIKNKINLLSNRMDTFTKLNEGSTTLDSEIIDSRINQNGTIFPNLGYSIRNQNSSLLCDLEYIFGDEYIIKTPFEKGGYISSQNGEVITHETWRLTDFIEIPGDISKLITKTTLNGSYSFNAFYDINKSFISSFSVNQNEVKIPSNAKYFRLSVTQNEETKIYKQIENIKQKCGINLVDEISLKNDEKLINDYMGVNVNYHFDYIEGGYINSSNGELIEYDNWKYTDYIKITENINELICYTTLTGSYGYNAFYDVNKSFISSFRVDQNEIKIPSNAKYFRISNNISSQTILKNKIVKLVDLQNSKNIDDIITFNKDLEPFIIQASEGLGSKFIDKTKPLVFTHFSDVHTRQELWNRIIEFNNFYSNYLKFSIHTGDYCGSNQNSYVDLYHVGYACDIPVFNCVGNHDTYVDSLGTKGTKQKTKELLFNHSENWNVTFMDIENSMTYYKDFPDSKIRLVVLDYYFDIDNQCSWLLERLNGAKALGYHVITCMHEMTNVITNKLNCSFQTIDNFESLGGNKYSISKFDQVIGDWVKNGGVHVANFAGHEHSDFIGYTENDVLNICVQAATDDIIWTDGKRVKGTRTWDCFNVVSVEVSTGTLKLIRIGNNSDHYLREKKVLSYDYINKNMIFN